MPYECLKLKNQICFPLYACSKELVRAYKPFLQELDLTYTQYITMMVLWEERSVNVKEIGRRLYLDSGTLTPLLKKLESKGYISRVRSKEDERNLMVEVTSEGDALQVKASKIPEKMGGCISLTGEEMQTLYGLLRKTLEGLQAERETVK